MLEPFLNSQAGNYNCKSIRNTK